MNNDRLAQLEERLAVRSEQRDTELREIREALATAIARQGNLESANVRIEAAIAGLKPPGLVAMWAPTVATAVMVGTLGVFVLNQRTGPMEKVTDLLTERQWNLHGTVEFERGLATCRAGGIIQ